MASMFLLARRAGVSALIGLVALAAATLSPARAVASLDGSIDALAKSFSEKTGVEDFSILLMQDETVLYRHDFGSFDRSTTIPIASATKWIVGAAVMTLVDQGKLSLDAPIKTYLPELPAPYDDLTLRQLLSYTAGLANLREGFVEFRQDRTISLAQSVELLSKMPLVDPPGTAFSYGGANFQFAGAIVERVTGKRWADYVSEVLARPLGMKPLYWSNPQAPVPPEKVTNPILQAGMFISVDAYQPFLTMIAQKGVYKGKRYLSEAAIEEMDTPVTHGLDMKYVPPGAGDLAIEYAIAHWCERESKSGRGCALPTSPGAFGVYPWVDRELGLHGIIFLQDQLERIANDVRRLRDTIIGIALTAGYGGPQDPAQ
ncbi:MAG: beta-lactamase family protein [Alphaproteobacteria bacterium]|nr:beta-lactamase family protein [Alphaproteobacteria bacterium]